VVAPGQSLDFVNRDASRDIFHTITGCRLPCTAQTGIAFPLANGPTFDSGELGAGPVGFTAASNRLSWQTPADLAPGTYAYFCRIHPFMRGAFRVEG
jgi:plastocyanin